MRPTITTPMPIEEHTSWRCPECGLDMPQFFGGYRCVKGHVVRFDTQAESDMRGWSL